MTGEGAGSRGRRRGPGKAGLWTALLAAGGLSLTLLAASVSAQGGAPSVPMPPTAPAVAAPSLPAGRPGTAGGPPMLNPAALPPGTAAAGGQIAAGCQGCHGPLGVSGDPGMPRLAGQQVSYLRVQLLLYRAGIRRNRVMNRVAGRLSDQNISDLGAYFSARQVGPAWTGQPSSAQPNATQPSATQPGAGQPDAQLTGIGARLYAQGDVGRNITACVVCHGRQGLGVNELGAGRRPDPPSVAGVHRGRAARVQGSERQRLPDRDGDVHRGEPAHRGGDEGAGRLPQHPALSGLNSAMLPPIILPAAVRARNAALTAPVF